MSIPYSARMFTPAHADLANGAGIPARLANERYVETLARLVYYWGYLAVDTFGCTSSWEVMKTAGPGATTSARWALDANELTFAADGSLTLHLSHKPPAGKEERDNWLPAPEGQFALIVRTYVPTKPILDGSYKLPNVNKTWSRSRLVTLRRAHQHADARPAGDERPRLHAVAHHRGVLAHPLDLSHRPQPSPERLRVDCRVGSRVSGLQPPYPADAVEAVVEADDEAHAAHLPVVSTATPARSWSMSGLGGVLDLPPAESMRRFGWTWTWW
jgi:hypothetical protein